MKAAEVVYYTIIAGLAVYSGIGAVSAFKSAAAGGAAGSEFALGTFETVMASVKTTEVTEFLTKVFKV
jgi:sulfite exporter TauE/SafE